jgi:membrane protease YdiL (CAAX protease family)
MRVNRRSDWAATIFALLFPSWITWLYFVALAQQPAAWQQTAYGLGKALQFAFPVIWLGVLHPSRSRWGTPSSDGWKAGLAFGVLVMLGAGALYYAFLQPYGWLEAGREQIVDKVRGFGVGTVWTYAALGTFYSLIHSGLEEYYWRWFVFRQLRTLVAVAPAILISSVGFMAHHVIVLGFYFGWCHPLTYLLSLSVALGGAFWAWLYERTDSLAGPWLSHMLVDAAIFVVGYDIVRHAI